MATSFKVIIVGGSVAGLTLAHCLDRLGIAYEILEQGEIAPQLGASVGILPNGGRILDQLGIFETVESEIEPLQYAKIRYPDGFSFNSQYPSVLNTNFGYPLSFLERRRFLQILHEKLSGKHRIHTNKKVCRIDDDGCRAVVSTTDGTKYEADLVVGADGVHSVVRSEIWRLANIKSPGAVTEKETSSLLLQYACVYGISHGVPFVEAGVQQSLLDSDLTIHLFVGTESKVFWFLIVRIPDERWAQSRRFSSDEARQLCEGYASKSLGPDLVFGDLWSRQTIFKMTPLEEGVFNYWNHGRLVCMGDAIRKMAPNIGQGANMAIEDAAILSSILSKANLRGNDPTMKPELEDLLQEYVKMQHPRTKEVCDQSEFVVRMQSNSDMAKTILGRR
ncbi:6-hydroxynicotinate 3-monooxygenase [Escovopsis weberi]|uniref:FAD-dependent monooxygenase janM n=1 Tax=Escovopsis weberi TaxID=150374 RepID=JANM_ESCWE|nr:6-hydroxynicotinate 3-monooxygenase [Escovopsis weberi]DAB41644.1 TPA_exp: FAD-dependent monooxygenase [Escovopsis weberi]